MDAAALRQSFSAVPIQPVRFDALPPRDAVATELPRQQSVEASANSNAVRTDLSPHAATLSRLAETFQRSSEARFERDRKTDTLVFKRIDPATGNVIMQIPDQSLLNLRAYLKQTEDAVPRAIEKVA